MSYVRHADTASALDAILDAKANSLVVIDFYANWCQPCHAISPVIDAYSKTVSVYAYITFSWVSDTIFKYPHVTFVKVDTEKLQDVAKKYNVKAMPTFHFIRDRKIVDTVLGADKEEIRGAIARHAGSSVASTSSSAETSDVSLLEFVDRPQINCLNELSEHTLKSILTGHSRNTSESYLESDTDEQLLLNIPFNQTVRVRGIAIQSKDSSRAPKLIKIQVNNPNVGFEDLQDAVEPQVAQIIELTEELTSTGKMIPLRFETRNRRG
ncbi:16749_t:CDS:2 [Acaulospora colombiana]|uniref:16749_t:CDS:1 n=1 Tax=Acaulospora colombiana TaxID=27376 RepID=A0ACA9MZE7_9GLOM|nr:16749_t:CDS:2 [Acaulospora colombiana]